MSTESLRTRVAQSRLNLNKRAKRIEDMQRKLESEQRAFAIEEARHNGLEEALQLADEGTERPAMRGDFTTGSGAPLVAPKRGGRQVGAISETWRRRLKLFFDTGADFHPSAMVKHLASEGLKSNEAEVVRTLKKYLEYGYVNLAANGTYKVTEYAAHKFGFASPKKTEGPASTGPSSFSVSGPAGSPGQLATHDVRDGSIPSGSTPAKNGGYGGVTFLRVPREGELAM